MARACGLLLPLLGATALDNGVARTPPLGWMSWMYYTTDITESIVRGVADELVAGGYRDAGYRYVAIDDGWSTSRDPATRALRWDPVKFPSGIPALAAYVHSKGLLFGMYADVGSLTCGGYAGLGMDAALASKQYVADAATFAAWGVDALKVDGCYQDPAIMNVTYPALSRALNATGRPMWFSCSWPCYVGGCGGGPATLPQGLYDALRDNCNTWRDFDDMYDNSETLNNIIGAFTKPRAVALHGSVNGPGSFSDADMLAAGGGGLSAAEEEMQMALWAMFATPMMMSNDLPNIAPASRALLLNAELIAINQDMAHPASFNVTDAGTFCRNLAGGAIALAGIHQTSLGPPENITLSPRTTPASSRLADCILPEHAGVTRWTFRDALRHRDLPPGAAVDCLVAQPGACVVVARPA